MADKDTKPKANEYDDEEIIIIEEDTTTPEEPTNGPEEVLKDSSEEDLEDSPEETLEDSSEEVLKDGLEEDSDNSPVEGYAEVTTEHKGASPVTTAPWDAEGRRPTGASDPARNEAIAESSPEAVVEESVELVESDDETLVEQDTKIVEQDSESSFENSPEESSEESSDIPSETAFKEESEAEDASSPKNEPISENESEPKTEQATPRKVVIIEDELVSDTPESKEKVTIAEEVIEDDGLPEGSTEPGDASPSADKSTTTDLPNTTQEETVTETITPKKHKSKAPLLILIICLLIAVFGFVAWWFLVRSNPSAQISEAVSNLITADHISMTGSIDLKFDESANPDIRSVKLDLGTTSERIPVDTSATLSITTQSSSTFKLDLGQAIAADGTIFIKVSGLQKAIDAAKVPSEVQAYLDYFKNVIKEADGQWWMIAVPDVMSKLNKDYSASLSASYAEAYECVISNLSKNNHVDLANLYQNHPIFDVTSYSGSALKPTDGGQLLKISLNRSNLKDFNKELPSTSSYKELKKCLSNLPEEVETENISIDDSSIGELNSNIDVVVEVSGLFRQQLTRLVITSKNNDSTALDVDLHFSYPQNISVDMPTSARSITELIDDIVEDTNRMMYNINRTAAIQANASGSTYYTHDHLN